MTNKNIKNSKNSQKLTENNQINYKCNYKYDLYGLNFNYYYG